MRKTLVLHEEGHSICKISCAVQEHRPESIIGISQYSFRDKVQLGKFFFSSLIYTRMYKFFSDAYM